MYAYPITFEQDGDSMCLVTVTSMQEVGEGTRVCLDFVDVLEDDEGVLLGNTGHGYVLCLAESSVSATYPARPFRVNAGAIHHYLLMGDDKTCYLSDIKSGMNVPVWKVDGSMRLVAVGRVKVEKRPLIRICLDADGVEVSVTVQQADSVRFFASDGVMQMVNLNISDKVQAHLDQPGRHIGERIDEYIKEF